MLRKSLMILPVLALLLAACGPAPAAPATSPIPTLEPTPMPTEDTRPRSPGAVEQPAMAPAEQALAAPAIADLAARLGVSPDEITVVEATEVMWPDASLGCPAPDMMYAQVVTEGILVVLEVDGQTYEYHGRTPDDLFLCGPDGPLSAAPDPSRGASLDSAGQAIVKMVTADMAQKLGVAEGSITVLAAEAMNWRTSGLGCEQPDQMYLQVITPGYQVVLTDGSNVYTYHTDARGRFVLCQQAVR